jgi:uncharacterized protein with WD repeat
VGIKTDENSFVKFVLTEACYTRFFFLVRFLLVQEIDNTRTDVRIHQGANNIKMLKSSALSCAQCCTDLQQSSLKYFTFYDMPFGSPKHVSHDITRAGFASLPQMQQVCL